MAVSRGRKSTKAAKSTEEVKKVEKKPAAPAKKAEKKVELPKTPKVEEVKQPEVVEAPAKVEEVVAPKVEEQPSPAPVVEEVVEVQPVQPVQEEVKAVSREVVIGSTVMMPSGKRGTVIRIDRKGRYEVQSTLNPRKTYLYEKTSLSLVK